jgi:hypothetical protein
MLINIWATLVHIGDEGFCKNSALGPDLDLLVCEALERKTQSRQIWIVNPFWRAEGTSMELLRDSYETLRESGESYLVVYTPGFADIAAGTPVEVAARAFRQLCRRARAFNKRVLVQQLGVPRGAPADVAAAIVAHNGALAEVVADFDGDPIDLTAITYRPWLARPMGPTDPARAADIIADAVMNAHAQADVWRSLHPAAS